MKLLSKSLLALLLFTGLSWGQTAKIDDSAKAETLVTNKVTGETTKLSVQIESVNDYKTLQTEIENAVKKAGPDATIVLSTDEAQVVGKVADSAELAKKILIAPYDISKKAEIDEKSEQLTWFKAVKAYPMKLARAANDDRIGFMIVTFTMVNETFVWMHTTHLSMFERTANVAFSLASAIAFSIDKQSWAKTVRPIKDFFRKILKSNPADGRSNPRELASTFLASLTMTTFLNLGRLSLVSIDKITQDGFAMGSLTYPLLMSFFGTMASFTWSEHIAMIDDTQIKTKFIFRRTMEIRSILLGAFAATAYLLHPETYGYSSWAVLIGSGAIGMTVYINAEKISSFIENNRFIDRVAQTLKTIGERIRCAEIFR
jgi:hypothetical protein